MRYCRNLQDIQLRAMIQEVNKFFKKAILFVVVLALLFFTHLTLK